MRRITVIIASALINASTIPGLAAESTLNKDVNPAGAVSATVHSKPADAADNEKTCRADAASFHEAVMRRQAAADRVDGAWGLTALDSVVNANCGPMGGVFEEMAVASPGMSCRAVVERWTANGCPLVDEAIRMLRLTTPSTKRHRHKTGRMFGMGSVH
jgi:hypothetical protein